MSDQQTEDIEGSVEGALDELFNIADRVEHWVLFELILTIGILCYMFYLFTEGFYETRPSVFAFFTIITIIRAILLFRVWYSTSPIAKLKADTVKSKMTYN